MANHKSAIKRAGQNQARRLRNRTVKTRIKNVVKDVRESANQGLPQNAASQLRIAQAFIDKASKKGVLHKRTAARKVSRLTRLTARSARS